MTTCPTLSASPVGSRILRSSQRPEIGVFKHLWNIRLHRNDPRNCLTTASPCACVLQVCAGEASCMKVHDPTCLTKLFLSDCQAVCQFLNDFALIPAHAFPSKKGGKSKTNMDWMSTDYKNSTGQSSWLENENMGDREAETDLFTLLLRLIPRSLLPREREVPLLTAGGAKRCANVVSKIFAPASREDTTVTQPSHGTHRWPFPAPH